MLETTPANIGPGSYLDKKNSSMTLATSGGLLNTTQSLVQAGMMGTQRGYMSNNLHFGVTDRFADNDKDKKAVPGPGAYNEQNRWNKRTYNLKFLNFQAQAFNTMQPAAGTIAGNAPAKSDTAMGQNAAEKKSI